ncbi:hypothetical protein GWI33_013209 [Rhynchophorus ferrugineus]|uniref:Uncharacterized protein n=1 Tax=Rhynchophorus ferrugineus TaxID=354439 RepID=A0A834MBS8_RHYFE|nr:hypothetical protein GWI33_013209 [Rhynchophorus ferrugineus]
MLYLPQMFRVLKVPAAPIQNPPLSGEHISAHVSAANSRSQLRGSKETRTKIVPRRGDGDRSSKDEDDQLLAVRYACHTIDTPTRYGISSPNACLSDRRTCLYISNASVFLDNFARAQQKFNENVFTIKYHIK